MGSTWRTRDGVIVPVQQIHTHPSYNAETMNFDVSLLKVRENTFHRPDLYVKPIKLPGLSEKIPNNSVATVSGWGHQSSSDHNLSYQLKYTQVFTVDQVECNNSLRIHGGVSNAYVQLAIFLEVVL